MNEVVTSEIGARLRQLRQSAGLKLREVSERCGVSVAFLSDVERGRTVPSLHTLSKIAAVYGQRVNMRFENTQADDPRWLNGGY